MNITTRENGRESKIRERVEIRNLRLPSAFHLPRRWRFLSKLAYLLALLSLRKMKGFKLLPERAREGKMRRGEKASTLFLPC